MLRCTGIPRITSKNVSLRVQHQRIAQPRVSSVICQQYTLRSLARSRLFIGLKPICVPQYSFCHQLQAKRRLGHSNFLPNVTRNARAFSTSKYVYDDSQQSQSANNDEIVYVNWIHPDGTVKKTPAKIGQSLLEVAHKNGIELEGACEGSLACSTCHVIIKDENVYRQLEEDIPATDEENDMLDLAFGLTETSRLGCQIIMSKKLDGIEVILPQATRNMAVDGYKPKPH